MGKDYSGALYEILTMGMESLYRTGRYEIDEEYRRFILGLLALL
jgi:hypothetical protein